MTVFGENEGLLIELGFSHSGRRHISARNRVFGRFLRERRCGRLRLGREEERKKKEKWSSERK